MTGWIIAIAIINVASLFYGTNVHYARYGCVLNLSCLGMMWACSKEFQTEKRGFILLWVVSLTGLLEAVEVFAGQYGMSVLFGKTTTAAAGIGSIGNSNYAGAYLIFPVLTSLGLVANYRGMRRWVAALVHLVCLVALYVTRARGAWAAVLVGYFVSLWLYGIPKKLLVVFVAVVLLLGASASVFAPRASRNWTDLATLSERWKYWQAAGWLWWHCAPIQGLGLWSYRSEVYEAQRSLGERESGYWEGYLAPKPRSVHNEYLEILVEGGILAAGVLGIFFFKVLSGSYCQAKTMPWSPFWAAEIAVLVNALVFFPFRVPASAMMTAVCLGALIGQMKDSKGAATT